MLDNLLKLILAIGSQDLIADVDALESKFNKALKALKNLPKVEQLEIIRATQVAVYKEYKLTGKIWNTAADVQKCFSNLAYLHKLARARDAGEKILHAMKRVLLLEKSAEFNALSIKYATNHNKHAQDVEDNGTQEVLAKFKGEVEPVKKILTKALSEADSQFRDYTAEINKLKVALEEAKTIKTPEGDAAIGYIRERVDEFTTAVKPLWDAIEAFKLAQQQLELDISPANLQKAFVELVGLTEKQLALKADPKANIEVVKAAAATADELIAKGKANEAKAKEAKDQIIAAFKEFAAIKDEAKADQGFISKLQVEHQKLTTAIATIGNVDAALKTQVAKEVYDGISDIDASDLHAGVKIKTVDGLKATFANQGDITAGAEALLKHKAVLEAKSAGEAIANAFTQAALGKAPDGKELDQAVTQYADNHNMHALNVLENTAPNDELREIMFKAMEKGLPFAAAMVRNLDLLKQKFIEMVEARK